MKRTRIATELVKIAGLLLGPGVPDGTGPMKNSPECPFNKEIDKQDDEDDIVVELVAIAKDLIK